VSGAVRKPAALSVIKVGGGLARVPGALDRVCSGLAELSREHALVVVPGGGPFSDAVRTFESRTGLSADAAHWMAILGMDQYAHALADRIAGAALVEEPGEVWAVLTAGHLAVLAPARWMRSADVLPHSWMVTSDSIAAYVAGALGANRLALIKPADSDNPVDPYFQTALPLGLPYLVLSWKRFEVLSSWLTGQTVAGARPA
jgi:5-(aminomethyl)-3-furanmethanol phosphate kinase